MASVNSLRLGPYYLDQPCADVEDSLTEAPQELYTTLGTAFADERIYQGVSVTFAGVEWQTTLSVTGGRIWKIALSVGCAAGELTDVFQTSCDSITRELGSPTGQIGLTGALEWQDSWGSAVLNRRVLGHTETVFVILTSAAPFPAIATGPTRAKIGFWIRLARNLIRNYALLFSESFRQDFLTWTDEEKERWTLLRAIEWGKWPLFVAQPFAPLLLVILPWWVVIAALVAATWLWSAVRYRLVSVGLLRFGSYFVHLKWPVCIAAAIYFISAEDYVLAAMAGLWPVVTLVLMLLTPPTMIVVIQGMLALRLLQGRLDARMGADPRLRPSLPAVENPSDTELGAIIGDMAANPDTRWQEVYERLNPAGDGETQHALDRFRIGRYDFNPWLAAKVLSAAYDHLAKTAQHNGDFRRLLGQAEIELHKVLAEAIKQGDELDKM